jgi:hypothetical protein
MPCLGRQRLEIKLLPPNKVNGTSSARYPTLHDARMISCESDSILGNLNMDFGSEADALQKLVYLPS